MTPEQVNLVKTSWAKVVPIAPRAAELFYGRLFELDPSVKPLFKNNMQEQGKKLMATISAVVHSLDNLAPMLPEVQNLGRRHVAYGVEEVHYETVGSALLWTLEQGLGAEFTPPVKQSWLDAYTALAEVMKAAVAEQT